MYSSTTQKNEIRLIDEALSSESITNTFRLGWEFIKVNQSFTITAMIIFITLNIMGTVPSLSVISMLLSSIFAIAIQIHVGKIFYKSRDIRSYIDEINNTDIDKLLRQNFLTGVGVYLGWVILTLLSVILLEFIGRSMGIIHTNMNIVEVMNTVAIFAIPILIIALFLSYIQPLVQSNIIMANGFSGGFKAVFSIFSIKLWRLSFNSSYFKYISIFGIVSLLSLIFLVFIIEIITNLIGLAIIGNVLMTILIYIFMIIMAIGSMMAKRLIELSINM